jgi:cytochrome b561
MTIPDNPARRRYAATSIVLHWTIAVLVLFQIGYAWWVMSPLPDKSPAHASAMALHFSIGLTVLILSVVRLAVRLAVPPPPLPAAMPAWERTLARASHVLFYVLIIGLPLAGWTLASTRPGPIVFFGLFTWPHLPGLAGLARAQRHLVEQVHAQVLVWTTLGLLALHVGAAAKLQFEATPVLWRMLPFLGPRAFR